MGRSEIVLKRGWPCSSRLMPVGTPMGFSGDFSSDGARVFSAQSFSDCAGWRFSNTSETGLSAKDGLRRFVFDFFSGIRLPTLHLMIYEPRATSYEQSNPALRAAT